MLIMYYPINVNPCSYNFNFSIDYSSGTFAIINVLKGKNIVKKNYI